MAEEEEVRTEVEAVEAVYGDECIVLNIFPPLLHLHLKPRTADVDSQQFVEATLELRAGPQYPNDLPCVDIIGSKGLDEKRQKHLSARLHDKAHELESCLMIVSLCEEAVEALSSMNHPEGDCPLCLYPLLPEDDSNKSQPFMKLMSCFHCFHCDCIIRWLKWFLRQNEANGKHTRGQRTPSDDELWQTSDLREMMGDRKGNCPVCRKVFLAKDIEHVLNSVASHGLLSDNEEDNHKEELLQCPLEMNRRQKFEAILELQQEHGGLIEPPKDNILFSRLSLQDLVDEPDVANNCEVSEQEQTNQVVEGEVESSGSSNQVHHRPRRRQRGHTATGTTNTESGSSRNQTRSSTGHTTSTNTEPGSRRTQTRSSIGHTASTDTEPGSCRTQTPSSTGHTASTDTEPGSSRTQTRSATGQHQRSSGRKQGRNNSKVTAQQWSLKE